MGLSPGPVTLFSYFFRELRERPRDDFRFSDCVFDRAVMAFVTVAVHTGSLGEIASACTATTTDNEGRFSFSGFKVGVGASWVVLYNVPLPFSHCLGGKNAKNSKTLLKVNGKCEKLSKIRNR